MKDQGWVTMDEGSAPPVPDEDGPTITEATARRMVRVAEPTKPQLSELFVSPQMQTLIPCRSEYTSARLDYGSGPNNPPAPVWGRFSQ
jgi:hypothetical protein